MEGKESDIVCPECKGSLTVVESPKKKYYLCHNCRFRYPIIEEVPFLIREIGDKVKRRQKDIYDRFAREWDSFPSDIEVALTKHQVYNMVDSFEFSSEDNVLEIGCGSGYRLYRLNNQYGIKGKGIDISSACIKYAIRLNEGKNDFYVADAESLPFGDNIFDFLLCIGVLEHMPHPSTVISEIFRVLKPGGQVLIWTPIKNCKYSFYWFSKRIFPQRVRESDMRAGHDPARFLSSESLIKILENNQLRVEKIQLFDAFFQPFYDYFILAILDKIAKGIKKAIKTMKSILQRKNQTTTEKGENSIIKKAQPKRFSIHSYLLPLAKVFLLFDKPLYKIGIGASIFIIACKKSKVIKYNT